MTFLWLELFAAVVVEKCLMSEVRNQPHYMKIRLLIVLKIAMVINLAGYNIIYLH